LALELKISDKKKILGQDIKISTKIRKEMRSGIERRQFSYDFHTPERRSGKERRSGFARKRKTKNIKLINLD
jgi:hypothetical protein